MGPFHPRPLQQLWSGSPRILHLISTKAHHIFNFCFKLFLRRSSSKKRSTSDTQRLSAVPSLPNLYPPQVVAALVFSLCIFLGLFFHSLIYAWGQLKLREHFGAAQGACVSAGMQCRLPLHKVENISGNMHLIQHAFVFEMLSAKGLCWAPTDVGLSFCYLG